MFDLIWETSAASAAQLKVAPYSFITIVLKPSLSLLKARMKTTYELELSIAKQDQTLEIHNKKWKELLPVVSGLV